VENAVIFFLIYLPVIHKLSDFNKKDIRNLWYKAFLLEKNSYREIIKQQLYCCASEIRTCTPALVLVMGALEEIYGITLRWSK